MMKEHMKNMNEEQKTAIREWLKRGDGHSVAPVDYYTDMGLPIEFLEPMVNRTWSNFVHVPKGISKVAKDVLTYQPIGWHEENKRWVFLLTPQQQEDGYIETRYGSLTESRTKRVWVEEGEFDDTYGYEEMNEEEKTQFKREHNVHPDASYQHMSKDVEYWVIAFRIPVTPETNYDKEPIEYDIKETVSHFLVKYDGTKRIDKFDAGRFAWTRKQVKKMKPMTKKASMDWVREQLARREENFPFSSMYMGDDELVFFVDGKQRAMKDIAEDYRQHDLREQGYIKEAYMRQLDVFPQAEAFVQNTKQVPLGWVHEKFVPLGYTDVMWNNNWMTPWVDGIGSTRVISALANALDVSLDGIGTLGRGSTARAYGKAVLTYLEEECNFAELLQA